MAKLTEHYGDVGPGWHAILTMLHMELMQVTSDYEALQVKEKFGGLRAYIGIPQEEGIQPKAIAQRNIAYALEYKYEMLSQSVCEFCGREGTNKPDAHGWYKTFCETHRQRREEDGEMRKWT